MAILILFCAFCAFCAFCGYFFCGDSDDEFFFFADDFECV